MVKLILIGRVGSGKTTLRQRIKKHDVTYQKTQAVEFCDDIIDTPGEYLENRIYLRALLVTAHDADVVILIEDATQSNDIFSYGFASAFNKPVIGVITKVDTATEPLIKRAKAHLEEAGASHIYQVGFNEADQLELLLKQIASYGVQ